MNKLWILIKSLYKQKLRQKSFILMTLLYIAVIAVVMYWSEIKSIFINDEALQVALINETTIELDSIFSSNNDIAFTYPSESENIYKQLEQEELDAVVKISEENKNLKANIITYTPLKLTDQSTISSLIDYASKIYGIQQLEITAKEAEHLLDTEPIIINTNLNEDLADGKSEDEKQSGLWASYFVGIVIYFFLMTFLSMITTDVASEKGSRALEMLLVSVKPGIHFQSKLIGVFLIALTQFAIIFGVIYGFLRFTDGGAKWEIVKSFVNEISYSYVLYVIVFLLLTIFLYLIMGALFGSLVSKVEEASQVMTPAILVMLVGFYVMISGIGNPDTMLIKVFSYIPFTSGMVMPMRIGATDISTIEPIISLSILFITVVVAYVISLSFYKRSVLTYSTGGIIQKIKTVFKVTT
ncbi:ABC transporter permease [Lysinibacillus telephonicus]|uniref:ABC transporter permease n=1 Tax=Lysinibacillus telephonicus TaxID=1714840 RepID=A0A3S0HPX2_9BACI|nr:ABC transporter permease [Lysinibacillus telephonicus]RTQ96050.1 ABC transporter permease [Lysinibacillus telephonicus]